MKGWREKEGFHIILEGNESLDLIVIIGEGVKAIEKWGLEDLRLQGECIKDAKALQRKFAIIFVSDNYSGSSKEKPIHALEEARMRNE